MHDLASWTLAIHSSALPTTNVMLDHAKGWGTGMKIRKGVVMAHGGTYWLMLIEQFVEKVKRRLRKMCHCGC